jgi:hypothetical protein
MEQPTPGSHVATVLKDWEAKGHTKAEFTKITGLSASYATGLWSGLQHPKPDTLEQILVKLPDRQLAATLLRAYLLDDVPTDWLPKVQIAVAGSSTEEEDIALQWLVARYKSSKSIKRMVETLWRMAHTQEFSTPSSRQEYTKHDEMITNAIAATQLAEEAGKYKSNPAQAS